MTSDPIAAFGVWIEIVFETPGELDTLFGEWESLVHLRGRIVPCGPAFGLICAQRLHR
jgi:hypothetical protein